METMGRLFASLEGRGPTTVRDELRLPKRVLRDGVRVDIELRRVPAGDEPPPDGERALERHRVIPDRAGRWEAALPATDLMAVPCAYRAVVVDDAGEVLVPPRSFTVPAPPGPYLLADLVDDGWALRRVTVLDGGGVLANAGCVIDGGTVATSSWDGRFDGTSP